MKKPLQDARSLALQRLSVREYAAHEMLSYLNSRNFSPETSTATVRQLVDENLLDDRRYARAVTRAQSLRNKGPGYILGKLQQSGVKIGLGEVRALFAEQSERSELDLARDLLERRYPRAGKDDKERKRAYGALLRRGFSPEVVEKCLFSRNSDSTGDE